MDFASAFMLTAFIELIGNVAPAGLFISLLTMVTETIRDAETYNAQTSMTSAIAELDDSYTVEFDDGNKTKSANNNLIAHGLKTLDFIFW